MGQSHAKVITNFLLDRENEELMFKLTQSSERQSFNRFSSSPEEIDEIHKSLPGDEKPSGEQPTDETNS